MCSNLKLVLRIALSTGGSYPNTASPAGYKLLLQQSPSKVWGFWGLGLQPRLWNSIRQTAKEFAKPFAAAVCGQDTFFIIKVITFSFLLGSSLKSCRGWEFRVLQVVGPALLLAHQHPALDANHSPQRFEKRGTCCKFNHPLSLNIFPKCSPWFCILGNTSFAIRQSWGRSSTGNVSGSWSWATKVTGSVGTSLSRD